MRLYLLAAVCAAASSTASAELLTFHEWTVEDDGRKCVMTYEDTDRMIDIIAEKGGFAQFATDPSTTGDIFKLFDAEVLLAGKSQGFRKGETRILSTQIGAGYVMKFEPQMLAASSENGNGEIRRDGKVIFRFPMKGAPAAAKALLACQARISG